MSASNQGKGKKKHEALYTKLELFCLWRRVKIKSTITVEPLRTTGTCPLLALFAAS
jgi:hypothetical protein